MNTEQFRLPRLGARSYVDALAQTLIAVRAVLPLTPAYMTVAELTFVSGTIAGSRMGIMEAGSPNILEYIHPDDHKQMTEMAAALVRDVAFLIPGVAELATDGISGRINEFKLTYTQWGWSIGNDPAGGVVVIMMNKLGDVISAADPDPVKAWDKALVAVNDRVNRANTPL